MSWITDQWTELKYAASDGACWVLTPISGETFGKGCPDLFDGFFVTLELLVLSCLLGLLIAVPMALARTSGGPILSRLASIYILLFRGTPLLIQLALFYYGFGSLGQDFWGALWPIVRDGWSIGLIVLTLNTSAYVAEILRGGLQSIERGQIEAAISCGLSWAQRTRLIVLPQTVRVVWPAYGNEVILLLKGSALVSTITVMDLMGETRTLFSRNYDLMLYVYAGCLYLAMVAVLTLLFRWAERRMRVPGLGSAA